MKDIFDKVEKFVLPIIVLIVLFLVLNIQSKNPEYNPYVPSYHNSDRGLNTEAFVVDEQKGAWVYYTVNISHHTEPEAAISGKIILQYYNQEATCWKTISDVSNSIKFAAGITINVSENMILSGYIPANTKVRIVSVSDNKSINSYIRGVEIY